MKYEVVNAALKAYDKVCRKADCGERPLYRPYDWNRKAKRNKVGSWYLRGGYESVIFVSSIPDFILQQKYQSEVNRQGLWIRVVEKAGRPVKSMVQRSDPLQQERCGQESCLMCTTGGKGSCGKEGITYSITCNNCVERSMKITNTNGCPI